MFLLSLKAIYCRSLQYETPCMKMIITMQLLYRAVVLSLYLRLLPKVYMLKFSKFSLVITWMARKWTYFFKLKSCGSFLFRIITWVIALAKILLALIVVRGFVTGMKFVTRVVRVAEGAKGLQGLLNVDGLLYDIHVNSGKYL